MKIYTRTGDQGTTALVGGTRVAKNSPRVEAYGTVDELNAAIGLIAATTAASDPLVAPTISLIQNRLFDLGAYLADPRPQADATTFGPYTVSHLEAAIDDLTQTLPPQTAFILPGGCEAAARTHMARTIARRAERRVIDLQDHLEATAESPTPTPRDSDPTPAAHLAPAIRFLNRLSDYLFILARFFNHIAGKSEIYWQKNC